MEKSKRVLVIGATGAMGQYLVPELLGMGYYVDAITMDEVTSADPRLTYLKGNAKDAAFIDPILANRYDGIVDFMIYLTEEFRGVYEKFLRATSHYIYLSSYRVYADEEHPIRESSPRLLDASRDEKFLASDDYSLYKARGEDILRASAYENWTVIRPAITYSRGRYQLVTLEANLTTARIDAGKTLVLPSEAKNILGTMTWAGDVAKMIARLLFLPKAMREVYTVSTSEAQTWGTIASYYEELVGMKCVWVDKEDYLHILCGDEISDQVRWQLEYDRLFSRVIDNSKILEAVGMKQEELKPLKEGLAYELSRRDGALFQCSVDTVKNARMDAYLAAHPEFEEKRGW